MLRKHKKHLKLRKNNKLFPGLKQTLPTSLEKGGASRNQDMSRSEKTD